MNQSKELVNVNSTERKTWDEVLERETSYAPLVDIYETDDDFVLVANMPGVTRDNIQLKLEDNSLVIFGKIDYEDKINRKYILNENEIGHYFRRFRISDNVDASRIRAKFENGQLMINLPKHERAKPKTIQIQ